MTKTVTFTVRPEEDVLSQFAETYRALRAGRRVAPHDGVSFTSIEAARNFLTPTRLALLRAVRRRQPGSVYALAKMVGRDVKNVQQDPRDPGAARPDQDDARPRRGETRGDGPDGALPRKRPANRDLRKDRPLVLANTNAVSQTIL